jgi:hypothetical protein
VNCISSLHTACKINEWYPLRLTYVSGCSFGALIFIWVPSMAHITFGKLAFLAKPSMTFSLWTPRGHVINFFRIIQENLKKTISAPDNRSFCNIKSVSNAVKCFLAWNIPQ